MIMIGEEFSDLDSDDGSVAVMTCKSITLWPITSIHGWLVRWNVLSQAGFEFLLSQSLFLCTCLENVP